MPRSRGRLVILTLFVMVVGLIPTAAFAATHTATIDFEPGLTEGDVVTSLATGSGISGEALSGSATVTAVGGSNDAVVFDSGCAPCAVDQDLASATGNVLVVSQDGTANDNGTGGTLTFDLSGLGDGVFTVVSLQVTDYGDESVVGSSITVDGVDSSAAMVPGGDGNVQTVAVGQTGRVLVVSTQDSYSVDSIVIQWDDPPPPDGPGTGTIGYWMNHPDAWPADSITIGGIEYSKYDAIAGMEAPAKGDKTYSMFEQLVAAKLNVMIGSDDSCISADIASADAWMAAHPLGSGVKAKSDAWQDYGSALHTNLDLYNNGELCAEHRG